MSDYDTDRANESFGTWWKGECGNATPTQTELECFHAGVRWALERAQVARAGSDLRGRMIVAFRPLFESELHREIGEPEPGAERLQGWPCLELDDGTLVYGAQAGHPFTGFKPSNPEGQQKVAFTFQYADRKLGVDHPMSGAL